MPETDEAKRRTFIPPLTLEHILLTELINAPSPVTPQRPRPFFHTLENVPDLPNRQEVTKKRIAIAELVNDDPAREPAVKRQKLIDDEPVTPSAVLMQQPSPSHNAFPENYVQPSAGAGLETLAALATTSTGNDGGENKENEYKHDNNANTGVKNHNWDNNNTNNNNTAQTATPAPQPISLSSSSVPPPSHSQKDRKYVCHLCSFRFHQAGGLRNHMRAVHLKEKPYGCVWPGCLRYGERGFAARGDLTRHVSSVHKGERNFRCDRCTMRFARRSVLVRHGRNIHGIGKR